MRGEVVVLLDQPREPVGAQVLPRHPQLERAEPPRALERELVPVQRLVLRLPHPVVLGLAVERVAQVLLALHEQRADVVGLEEPLVRIDRDGVGPRQPGHAVGVAGRQAHGTPVRGVHVEPQAFPLGHVGELVHRVDRARVRRARRRARCRTACGPPRDPRRWPRPRCPRGAGTCRPTAGRAASPPGSPACPRRARSRSAPDRTRRCARPPAARRAVARRAPGSSRGGRRARRSAP